MEIYWCWKKETPLLEYISNYDESKIFLKTQKDKLKMAALRSFSVDQAG